jgi:hypothetical protein
LLGRKARISCLGNGRLENIQHANILMLTGNAREAGVQFSGLLFGELGDGLDTESTKVLEHGRADGDEVLKLSSGHGHLLISLFIRWHWSTMYRVP